MKTILKKMTALFATALILLTALPVSASAQSRIQIENADVFGTTQEIVIGDGLFIDHRNYWCMMHTTDSMRAGRSVSSGDVYETDDTYSYLDCVQNPTLTSAEIQQLLKRVFQHAYTGNLDTAESYFQYVATQLLVWEVVVGQRDMNFEFADNGYDSVSLVLTCFENSYAADKVGKYYLQYEEAIKNHAESVSFAYSSEYDAEEFVVEADENNMYTFIDDNAVLSQFKVTVMGGHIIELTDSTLQI
ncbi:MAG: Cys-Gln thioester bond-forming surface protein [Oscillospiraceae bacterium]|nr:Cys-Gln thioester bond-forming surface protein [Oscillospiraceae bacterium]